MKIIIFLLFTVICFGQKIDTLSIEGGLNLYDLSIIKDNIYFSSDSGRIFNYNNKLNSFSIIQLNTDVPLTRIDAFNDAIIVLGGNYTLGFGFFLSYDNGATWNYREFDFNEEFLFDTYFLNPEYGFVTSLSGKIFITLDGLNNWREISDPQNLGDVFDVYFKNNLEGWICGGRWDIIGYIKHTSNGGESWETLFTTPEPIQDIFYFNEDTLFASGGDPEYGGRVFVSYDKGITWETLAYPLNSFTLASISYSHKKLWATGAGGVYISENMGFNWDELIINNEFIFEAKPISQTEILIYGTGGFIIKYTDTTETITGLNEQFSYYKKITENKEINIFPNPSNNAFNINLENIYEFNFSIFDILGNKIQESDYEIFVSSKNLKFVSKNFASGIYFIILQNKSVILSNKVILIK